MSDESWDGTTKATESNAAAVAALNRRFDTYVTQTLNPIYADFGRVKEKVEVLDGARSRKAADQAAVRYRDLSALDRFPSRPPNYRYLGAAPTADDYNKLAADVKKLYEAIGALAAILATKS